MLTANYLSHEVLGLPPIEHRVLIDVLGILERGEVHLFEGDVYEWDLRNGPPPNVDVPKPDASTDKFSMAYWCEKPAHGCGTVHCMGGLAEAIGLAYYDKRVFADQGSRIAALADLFFPGIRSGLVYDY